MHNVTAAAEPGVVFRWNIPSAVAIYSDQSVLGTLYYYAYIIYI